MLKVKWIWMSSVLALAACSGMETATLSDGSIADRDASELELARCAAPSTTYSLSANPCVAPPRTPTPYPRVLIADIPFADPDLKACAIQNAESYSNQGQVQYSDQLVDLFCLGEPGMYQYDITSLGGIEYLVNLRTFTVGRAIDDASSGSLSLLPIKSLKSIEYLGLAGPRITDLTPAKFLTRLQSVALYSTQIQSLEPLVSTPLVGINLTEGPMPASLEPLSRIPTFYYASVGKYNYEMYNQQLSNVVSLPNLRSLSLFGLYTNANGIENATQLESLYLSVDVRVPPSQLSNLTNLRELSFSNGNAIWGSGDISGLAPLTNLLSLTIPDAWISDISPLAGMTKLQYLSLPGNRLTNLQPLAGMTVLRGLSVNGNPSLQDLAPIQGLTGLEFLDVSDDDVADLSPVSGMTNLMGFYAAGNRITSVTPLYNLSVLNSIYLWGNDGIPCSQLAQLQAMHPNGWVGAPATCVP